ncbi:MULTISPECIES: hypothetical protein [Halobacillus]|uniref:Uncharacterized protein n=2 Tax=Halobacillus TaxID=45667 RepID=A0A3E0JC11_9BACI|nr:MULTISPECIES: hypothetical protein [Halobacillus]RDY69029.1 hypothetical protein DXT76_17160 [Halobacillus trueperi]REJ10410.1 hypothetical protein DYE48_02680 [Halobacillus trueperi]SDO67196.1 hypothetical protein SAMN05421677_10716 [Halobacillus aidingensis]
METAGFVIILAIAILLDYLWFDHDRKRWGWMKNWTRIQRGLFLASFFVAAMVIYIGMSL